MLLTVFHNANCIKSRFLRLVLREMSWDLRELDVNDPAAAGELTRFKGRLGSGSKIIAPAIYSNEAYSHELLCILEYLHERNPGASMYPDDPPIRLYARTILNRVIRQLVPAWDAYQQDGNTSALVALYAESEEVIENLAKSPATFRASPDMPIFLEILLALLTIEVSAFQPITKKPIVRWAQQMKARPAFAGIAPAPGIRA